MKRSVSALIGSPFSLRALDDLVVDVGDVAHERDAIARRLEVAPHHVEHDQHRARGRGGSSRRRSCRRRTCAPRPDGSAGRSPCGRSASCGSAACVGVASIRVRIRPPRRARRPRACARRPARPPSARRAARVRARGCVPVSAARSGMNSAGALAAGGRADGARPGPEVRRRGSRHAAAACSKNPRAGRGDLARGRRRRARPSRSQTIATSGSASAGNSRLPRTAATNAERRLGRSPSGARRGPSHVEQLGLRRASHAPRAASAAAAPRRNAPRTGCCGARSKSRGHRVRLEPALVPARVAEPHQVVAQRAGQVALAPQVVQARRAVALRQRRAARHRAATADDRSAAPAGRAPRAAGSAAACWRGDRHRAARA